LREQDLNLRSLACIVASESVLTVLEVRKPKKDEWVRCNETIATAVNIYETTDTRETFLILPDALEAMENVVKYVCLTLAVNYNGEVFIWPVPIPLGNKPYRAYVSAHAAAELATSHWIRIAWDGTGYNVTRRKNCRGILRGSPNRMPLQPFTSGPTLGVGQP